MSALAAEVHAALAAAVVDGATVRLVGQLDRKTYAATDKALRALGGKWDRKAGAHVFPGSPGEALAAMLASGQAPAMPKAPHQIESYFATPDALAQLVVEAYTDVPGLSPFARVLEPSAGDGALVRAVRRVNPGVEVVAVEPNAERAGRIDDGSGLVTVQTETFETVARRHGQIEARPFDAVVMNPPFTLPGAATAWIDHVNLAWSLLRPGGRLTAIVPAGFTYRTDRKHRDLREWVGLLGGWRELPEKSFTASGTDVATVAIWMEKP
ncbi:methyltransferase [Parafrankia sp. FMc2]|uniref:methyltransferase n=1 Tax=Parafrankia sp. FMc2 TaxID=3233196 RepID=UPI0034D748D5